MYTAKYEVYYTKLLKTKTKRIIKTVLTVFLILLESAAVVLSCAVINVFSQINVMERQRTAGHALILSSINSTDLKSPAKASIEEYIEEHRWKGPVLSRSAGTVIGPSGKETYYNLNMTGVVNIMRRMGNEDEYWVREDGCKMLGDYIMVAANLNVHPRGSIVDTSLGEAIVCDTGGFAARNPHQLDIAVNW